MSDPIDPPEPPPLDDDGDGFDGRGLAAWLLPFGTSFLALAVGALIGAGVMAMIPRQPTLVEISKDLTNEEIDALCAPKVDEAVADAAGDLEEAQGRVRTLEAQVDAKQREVERLEADMERRAEKGSALAGELERARGALRTLETELERAIEEKETLMVELRRTEVALEEQEAKTDLAKEESLVFKWRSFVGYAQLEVCDKGLRRRMGRCRETVAAAFDREIRREFERCLKSGQEMPTVGEVDRPRRDELPAFAVWIDQDERVTRGWYVQLCDPTLPEPDQFAPVDIDDARTTLGGEDL